MVAIGVNHFERQTVNECGNRQAEIDLIEALARDAWPAAQADWVGGWLLRFTYGITRRANSVWPNSDSHGISELTFDERLNEVELFYAIYETPARFQISPASRPADLDIALALRGYQRTAETAVQTAKLDAVLHETGRRLPEYGLSDRCCGAGEPDWFQTYDDIEQFGKRAAVVRHDIIKRIRDRTGFALATLDGEPVALGLGVVSQDGWVSSAWRPMRGCAGGAPPPASSMHWPIGLSCTAPRRSICKS